MSSPRKAERKAARLRAIQNAADQRALNRVEAVTATVQLRLFHGLVPVACELAELETRLGMLKNSTLIAEDWKEMGADLLGQLEIRAREAASQIRRHAEQLGYPIEEEMARFNETGASIATLQEMRETLDWLDDADWDVGLRQLRAHETDAD